MIDDGLLRAIRAAVGLQPADQEPSEGDVLAAVTAALTAAGIADSDAVLAGRDLRRFVDPAGAPDTAAIDAWIARLPNAQTEPTFEQLLAGSNTVLSDLRAALEGRDTGMDGLRAALEGRTAPEVPLGSEELVTRLAAALGVRVTIEGS